VPRNMSMAQWALRWILMDNSVTCVIPGGRRPTQIEENVGAAELDPLSPQTMAAIREVYVTHVKPLVHAYW
jgi:aryl-alcohol dehydrogenase-like predicted oxidoreductase